MLEETLAVPATADVANLRRIVCSGEALSPRTVERAAKVLPQVKIHNLYGPTEAAVEVTLDTDPEARIGSPTRGSVIGRPGANVCLYVLDRYLRPVPAGTPGELYIGGVQVAQGYLRRRRSPPSGSSPTPTVIPATGSTHRRPRAVGRPR